MAEGDKMSGKEAAGLASGLGQLLQPPLNTQLEYAKEGEPRHHIWLVTPSGLPQSSLPSSRAAAAAAAAADEATERKPDLSLLRILSAPDVPERAASEGLRANCTMQWPPFDKALT